MMGLMKSLVSNWPRVGDGGEMFPYGVGWAGGRAGGAGDRVGHGTVLLRIEHS